MVCKDIDNFVSLRAHVEEITFLSSSSWIKMAITSMYLSIHEKLDLKLKQVDYANIGSMNRDANGSGLERNDIGIGPGAGPVWKGWTRNQNRF